MKYLFEINSRVAPKESAESKHQKFLHFLESEQPPWGISNGLKIEFPGFGKEFVSTVVLSKFLGSKIKMEVYYRYRNMLDNHHSSDDRIFIEFDTKNIDFKPLVEKEFSRYVSAFDAYSANIFCESLIYKDFERSRNTNGRKDIVRFYPVAFYDEKYCKDALKKSPKFICDTLKNHVYKAEILNKGILIIAAPEPLSEQASDEYDALVRDILKYRSVW